MNKVILYGNLGADPEVRAANSGTQVCTIRLATSERTKDHDGNWGEHTEWHRVVCFGKTAENAGKYLARGSSVLIEGKIRTRKWTDQAGVEKYSTEVIADNVTFGRQSSDGGRARSGGQRANARPVDDDVPF